MFFSLFAQKLFSLKLTRNFFIGNSWCFCFRLTWKNISHRSKLTEINHLVKLAWNPKSALRRRHKIICFLPKIAQKAQKNRPYFRCFMHQGKSSMKKCALFFSGDAALFSKIWLKNDPFFPEKVDEIEPWVWSW